MKARSPVEKDRKTGTPKAKPERRRIENALRETEKVFFNVFQYSPVPMAITSLSEGRFFGVNEQYTRLMEFPREELIGHTTAELNLWADPEARKKFLESLERNRGAIQGYPISVRTKSGNILKILFSADIIQINDAHYLLSSAVDVTDHVRTQEALRRTEENFRRSLDDSPLGARIVTAEGETLYTNRAILDFYGYDSIEELQTTPLKERYTPESCDEHRIRKEKRRRGDDTPSEYEVSIVRKDGEVRQLQVIRKLTLWNGEQQFQVIYQDITERKRMEAMVRESEKRYRGMFENSVTGISQALPDGRLIAANTAYAQMYGYTNAEEMMAEASNVGQRYANPKDREEVLRILKEKGVMEPREITVVRRNGTRFTVLAGAREIRNSEGTLKCYQAEHIDISAHKAAEEALRESEDRYRSLFDNSMDAVLLTAPDGRILAANPEACQIFGWTEEEICRIGRAGLLDLKDPRLAAALEERARTGRFRGELTFVRKSGAMFTGDVSSVIFLDRDGNSKTSMIIRDITERKQSEEVLRRSREQLRAFAGQLQAAREEERTQIAREIHDEMGGALTAMKIDFSLLARTVAMVRDKALRDSLCARMDDMTKLIDATMQTVRRIATGLRPGILDDLGLKAALEWQLADFRKRTGIRCGFTSSAEFADPDGNRATALFRIAQEALTNVARHARATDVCIRLEAGASGILLEVEDNGVGITKEELQDPKSFGILGMRERALSFGGRVAITRRPGKGTVVAVESPPVDRKVQNKETDR